MACAHPIVIRVKGDSITVPCRQCLPCRINYQSQIVFAATNELYYAYRDGYGASFCCLTYDDEHLPGNGCRDDVPSSYACGSLYKRDLQLFMKRIRFKLGKANYHRFKYIACGEYGDKFDRAHMHIVFIGLCDSEVKSLFKSEWKYGLTDVQPLGVGGVRYVTKYCTKQIKGEKAVEMYDNNGLERPFLLKSVKMGYRFLNDNMDTISNDNYHVNRNGVMVPIPAYYRKIVDSFKSYDNLSDRLAFSKTAATMGLSVAQYRKYISHNLEKMLVDKTRAAGIPVDDSKYHIEGGVTRGSGFGRMIEDIIDPIPF